MGKFLEACFVFIKRITYLIPRSLLRGSSLLICILAIFSFVNIYAASVWNKACVPGTYDGKDENGGIICLGTTGTCFCVWTHNGDPAPGNSKCCFVPSTNWGLTDINGMIISQVQGGFSFNPQENGNTQEVNNENAIISWMNEHYPPE
jgi:hypothetical protein